MAQQIKDKRNNSNIMCKAIQKQTSASQRFFSKDVNTVTNEFNNFLTLLRLQLRKISTLTEKFQCEGHDFLFVPREYTVSEQFVFYVNVNINQGETIIKSMEPNKSPGIDKMPVAFCPAFNNIDYQRHLSFFSISQRLENCRGDTYFEGWRSGSS